MYLTGSHIWSNFHDGMGPGSACAGTPERLGFGDYLDFLEERGHNFIRLWRWEHFISQAAGGEFHLCMTPQPWARAGPGVAKDGKPKFDLTQFDESFFERLRERVAAAGERGMYVAVMLLEGWALHLSPAPDHAEGHPFHAGSNVNGIGIGTILDYQVLPLDPRVQETPGGLCPQGRRHAPRSAERPVGGRKRVLGRRTGRRGLRGGAGAGRDAQAG